MSMKFLRYWERNGKRRPFPPLYEAIKNYGAENVLYPAPQYAEKNQCPWCGKEVTNRRRRYCSNDCRQAFSNATVWHRGRDAYSLRILYRDHFTCQDCGKFHAFINNYSMVIPIDDGKLEVHHILPVSFGGGDEPNNLLTLCKDCHKERHRSLREG